MVIVLLRFCKTVTLCVSYATAADNRKSAVSRICRIRHSSARTQSQISYRCCGPNSALAACVRWQTGHGCQRHDQFITQKLPHPPLVTHTLTRSPQHAASPGWSLGRPQCACGERINTIRGRALSLGGAAQPPREPVSLSDAMPSSRLPAYVASYNTNAQVKAARKASR